MIVKLRWTPGEAFYLGELRIGPDREHLASTGTLRFRPDEAVAYRSLLFDGDYSGQAAEVIEQGWREPEPVDLAELDAPAAS